MAAKKARKTTRKPATKTSSSENKLGQLMAAAAVGGIGIAMFLNAAGLLSLNYVWTIPAMLIAVVFVYSATTK